MTNTEFTNLVDQLNEATRAKFGDYGFACGYLAQVVINLYKYNLTDFERQKLERQLQHTIDQHALKEA